MSNRPDITAVYCEAASLLGYGKLAHAQSDRVCLYCGMGLAKGEMNAESVFDLWRQLTVEHIVPDGVLSKELVTQAVRQWLHVDSDQQSVWLCIHDMNLASACHFCNSTVSHHKKKPLVTAAIREFQATVRREPQGVFPERESFNSKTLHDWLANVGDTLYRIWEAKAQIARGKVKWVRQLASPESYSSIFKDELCAERTIDYDLLERLARNWRARIRPQVRDRLWNGV